MIKLKAKVKQAPKITAHIKTQKIKANIKTGGQIDSRVDYQTTDFATLLKLQTGIN